MKSPILKVPREDRAAVITRLFDVGYRRAYCGDDLPLTLELAKDWEDSATHFYLDPGKREIWVEETEAVKDDAYILMNSVDQMIRYHSLSL